MTVNFLHPLSCKSQNLGIILGSSFKIYTNSDCSSPPPLLPSNSTPIPPLGYCHGLLTGPNAIALTQPTCNPADRRILLNPKLFHVTVLCRTLQCLSIHSESKPKPLQWSNKALPDLALPTPQSFLALFILPASAHSASATWASWMFLTQTKSTHAPAPCTCIYLPVLPQPTA